MERCPYPASRSAATPPANSRSEEHTSELQSQSNLVCRLLLEKKKRKSMSGTGNIAPICATRVTNDPRGNYFCSRGYTDTYQDAWFTRGESATYYHMRC